MAKRLLLLAVVPALFFVGIAVAQYPILDMVANKVIEKYQSANCEQLWEHRGKPRTEQEQNMIRFLRSDPKMRTMFFDRISAPVMNKMFDCGMIP